jgi:predicted acyltransferase
MIVNFFKCFVLIVVGLSPMILAGIYPFIQVRRNGRVINAFFACWGLNILFAFVLVLSTSLMDQRFGAKLGNHISSSILYAFSLALEMASFGWIYAGITVILALSSKRVAQSKRNKPGS